MRNRENKNRHNCHLPDDNGPDGFITAAEYLCTRTYSISSERPRSETADVHKSTKPRAPSTEIPAHVSHLAPVLPPRNAHDPIHALAHGMGPTSDCDDMIDGTASVGKDAIFPVQQRHGIRRMWTTTQDGESSMTLGLNARD